MSSTPSIDLRRSLKGFRRTSVGDVLLIAAQITLFLSVIVTFYSPAEVKAISGHDNLVYVWGFYLSCFIIFCAIAVISIVSSRFLCSIIAASCAVILVLNIFMGSASIALKFEHAWTKLKLIDVGDICDNQRCGAFKVIARKTWGDGCADYLVYIMIGSSPDGKPDNRSPRDIFRERLAINTGTNIYQEEIRGNYYSEIACEQ